MVIVNGQTADADEVMNAFGLQFKNSMNAFFNSDYDGWNAKLANTGSPQVQNLFYDTLQTDSAAVNYGWWYDATNDLYQTVDTTYVKVSATSYTGNWTNGTNNVHVTGSSSTGWSVFCDTGTADVRRAQIIKTLFYGTNGANPLVLEFTTMTALQTTVTRDVDKRGHYIELQDTTTTTLITKEGTPANTADNDDCSLWSNLTGTAGAGQETSANAYIPSSTKVNTASGGGPTNSDELGTDTSGDEVNNPANFKVDIDRHQGSGSGINARAEAVILTKGTVSWSTTGGTPTTDNDTDYTADHSIPAFTALSTDTSTLIFQDTASATATNTLSTWNASIDAASTLTVSISYDGGTNYETITDATIQRNANTGTAIWLKFEDARTDLTKTDKIMEQATAYNWY